jgi:adenosylcobinamide-phosphate synthase
VEGQVERALIDLFRPHPAVLLAAVGVDLLVGDPVYAFHPIRIIGRLLSRLEDMLRRAGADGYGGGIALFALLTAASLAGVTFCVVLAEQLSAALGWLVQVFFAYSSLALGDLVRHVWRVEQALSADDLPLARQRISGLVGRDVDRMDAAACRRAAIESLSENLTDGFTSPIAWYAVGGLPGLVVFKVVSTMDSMVGYKTPRYLRFGWCGARLDDLMNYPTARATWLLIAATAAVLPSCSAAKAFRVGLRQHAILLGPNSGWSEAATAGGIQRRLVGPIWMKGQLVTDVWIGDLRDPPAETRADVVRGLRLVTISGLAATALALAALMLSR